MKSRPYVLYLVLGVAALALWQAWRSAHRPADDRPPAPVVVQATPPEVASAPAPTPGTPPLAAVPGGSTPAAVPAGATGSIPPGPTAAVIAAVPTGNAPGPAAAPGQTAQTDVVRVRHMVSDYHTLMGENPVGTNAEIMKQMTGENSRQATLGPPDGMALNGQGELVDPWGTPYFFHQLSRDKMEVRGAGPDRVMWTADDVIAR